MSSSRWKCTVCLTGYDEAPHVCDLATSVRRLADLLRASDDAFTRFIAAYESLRRRFGDEYEGRFAECDELVKRHDESVASPK
jgi:hypothetical protein